ncbi:MAG TPA: hypothetical protein VF443_14880 [Nitrospira sp.]
MPDPQIPPDWLREDGTLKGLGFLGPLRLPNGVASEFSIADSEQLKDANGHYLDYPSLVPTLSRGEVQAVLRAASDPTHKTKLPDSVYSKAEAFALQRRKEGLPLFARPNEIQNIYPDLPRANAPDFVRQNYDSMQQPKGQNMPDKIIEIPNVGRIAFPDSMTPDEMNAAAAKLYKEKNPDHPPPDPKHSWVDTAVDWLPTAAGAVGGLVGATGGPLTAIGGAALGGAAGQAAKNAIQEMRGQRAPQSLASEAGSVVGAGAMQGAAEATGVGIGALASKAAPRLMQSAVKPTLGMLKDVIKGAPVPRVVQTLLDEGVNVSPAGFQKLTTLLNATKDERDRLITEGMKDPASGVNPFAVTSRLKQTAQQFGSQVNPEADLNAISKAGQEFLDQFGGDKIALDQANQIKQGTYDVLRKKYGQLGSADVEAQKALARGLKEEIEQQAPGVDVANRRLGNLSEAEKAVGRRIAVASNRDSAGILWVAHNPAAFLAGLMDRSPAVKSMLARGLYTQAGSIARVSPQLIRGAVGVLAAEGSDDGLASSSGGSSSGQGSR